MIGLEVKGARETQTRLGRARQELERQARSVVLLALGLMRRKLIQRMSARAARHPFWGKGSPAGAFLGARTGKTIARISSPHVFKRGANYEGAIGSPDRHVLLHEKGGTVRGTSPRGFLRIPTAAAQSLSGAEQQRFAGRSLRNVPGVFLIRTKAGRLWAAEKNRNRVTLLFLLLRSVTHRPRGIFAAVAKEMEVEFVRLGNAGMRAVVRAAGGA